MEESGMTKRVTDALNQLRDLKSTLGIRMTPSEYKQFLEELLADAEGWKMELDENE